MRIGDHRLYFNVSGETTEEINATARIFYFDIFDNIKHCETDYTFKINPIAGAANVAMQHEIYFVTPDQKNVDDDILHWISSFRKPLLEAIRTAPEIITSGVSIEEYRSLMIIKGFVVGNDEDNIVSLVTEVNTFQHIFSFDILPITIDLNIDVVDDEYSSITIVLHDDVDNIYDDGLEDDFYVEKYTEYLGSFIQLMATMTNNYYNTYRKTVVDQTIINSIDTISLYGQSTRFGTVQRTNNNVILNPIGTEVYIDSLMADIIEYINLNPYIQTKFCCESHDNGDENDIYISGVCKSKYILDDLSHYFNEGDISEMFDLEVEPESNEGFYAEKTNKFVIRSNNTYWTAVSKKGFRVAQREYLDAIMNFFKPYYDKHFSHNGDRIV